MMVEVVPVGEAESEAVGIIGPAAYAAAYHHLWPSAADLAEHLHSFGPAAVRAFLSRSGAAMWLAQLDGRPVGFLSLLLRSPDPVTRSGDGAEISRIFLLPGARGQGVGPRLLAPALAAARAAGMEHVWLDAMDSAPWAIGAYRRWGFAQIGTARFAKPVHPHLAGMVVMRRDL